MKITKVLFYAVALATATFAVNTVTAIGVYIPGDNVLTLSGTYHTQGTITNEAGDFLGYRIVQTPFNTKNVLDALAADLGVTNNGKAGFPTGSFLAIVPDFTTPFSTNHGSAMVKNHNGQSWDVSSYIQYSFASEVILAHGKVSEFTLPAGGVDPAIKYTYLAHFRFEDANHLVDMTGFATESYVNAGLDQFFPSETDVAFSSGSGMIDGKGALITGRAEIKFKPLFPPFPAKGNQATGE